VNGVGRHSDNLCRLCNDWVNLAIDPDAPVPASLARLVGEPMVPVPTPQDLNNGNFEPLQLSIGTCMPATNKVN